MTQQFVTYDGQNGVSYIYIIGKLAPGSAVRTVAIPENDPAICLDFDKDGHLIGIELLRADLLHPELRARAISSRGRLCQE